MKKLRRMVLTAITTVLFVVGGIFIAQPARADWYCDVLHACNEVWNGSFSVGVGVKQNAGYGYDAILLPQRWTDLAPLYWRNVGSMYVGCYYVTDVYALVGEGGSWVYWTTIRPNRYYVFDQHTRYLIYPKRVNYC